MKQIFSVVMFLVIFSSLSGQDKFTDKRDGNVYRTVTISGKTWMIDNLKFKAASGSQLFDNDTNNIRIFGSLYEWNTAVNVCPDGWHLPSGQEFRNLSNNYDQKKSWKSGPSEPSSFQIQLGGMQNYEGIFTEMYESAYYWTSTEYGKNNAEYFSYLIIDEMPVIDISREDDIGDIQGTEKSNKYSVRCVKN